MKTSQRLWAVLSAQPFPCLHELAPVDRDGFVLLNDCARTITKRFSLLDGEGQCYFGQFRRLARRILCSVDVDEAYHQTELEQADEFD